MDDLTDNAFLGGRLHLLQPRQGYRAGIDPVLLAAACPLREGAKVLDLGCGVGTALFCAAVRRTGMHLTGVELNDAYAALARRNAQRNGIEARIVTADITALPADLRQERFDVILANPPYFDRRASSASKDAGREGGRGESVPLATWIDVAARRLLPGGSAVVIQRAERLPEVLTAMSDRLGALVVTPLAAREGRPAKLAIVKGIKGRSATFCLGPPIILHRGDSHDTDGDSYTDVITHVLREGCALPTR